MFLAVSPWAQPTIAKLLNLLDKIDRLQLPAATRQDIESILVRQITHELDEALPDQYGHGRRTASLAVAIGSRAGLPAEALHDLKLAALLHDVGLLSLPSRLAVRPGFLTSDEYAAVQCHSRVGAELLESFQFLKNASVLVAHHHERWDGTGYPYGLRGAFIPIGARILAIADAFDAIDLPELHSEDTRRRVAFRILKVAAGTQFDPGLIELLYELLQGNPTCGEGASPFPSLFRSTR